MPTKFNHYEFDGSWFEMGKQLGRAEAHNIERFNRQYFSETFNLIRFGGVDTVKNYVSNLKLVIQEYSPDSWEFIKGISEGSNIQINDVLKQLIIPELTHISSENDWPKPTGCTAGCVLAANMREQSATIAQCWDFNFELPPWYVLTLRPSGGYPEIICVGAGSVFCCCGINSFTIGVTFTSSGHLPNIAPTIGLPVVSIMLEALLTEGYSEARDIIVGPKRAGAFNALLSDGYNRSSLIECAGKNVEIIEQEKVLICGNHFQHPKMIELTGQDMNPPDPPAQEFAISSLKRTERLRELIDSPVDVKIDIDYLESCLRDHKNRPLSICAHQENTILHFRTLAAVILEPANHKIHLCPDQPCQSDFQTISILE